jgi:hypothetical protein
VAVIWRYPLGDAPPTIQIMRGRLGLSVLGALLLCGAIAACSSSNHPAMAGHRPVPTSVPSAKVFVSMSIGQYDCSVNPQGHPQAYVTAYSTDKSAPVTARAYVTVRLGHSAKTFLASNPITIPAGSMGSTTVTFSTVTTRGTVHCSLPDPPTSTG